MDQYPSHRLRLGRISFMNVLPIYHPLESGVVHNPFDIIPGIPSQLNDLMARGSLDLSVVSSIEYARHPERYFILPDLSISCCGKVKSVLLLSRVPVEELPGKPVLVSTQSHTSVALLKILLSLRFGIEARFEPANCTDTLKRGELPYAFLAIGDEALRLNAHELYPYRLDLGEAWHEWTGLPFVFALWVIQRKVTERSSEEIRAALDALSAAKKWGTDHLDIICNEAAKQGILSSQELHDYYACLGYNLETRERSGLDLFFSYLHRIGEINEPRGIDIYSPLDCVA